MDLLKLVENGGCSAKLSASDLAEALKDLPKNTDKRLLVDIDTHDDAGVYKLTDELALIQTTDFFPPVCSDPYDFGQIAAANALSDVYAMGGTPVNALNLVMFPKNISLDVLRNILDGGLAKIKESGAVVTGGHTITDDVPKYGLAVTGIVHPEKIITNANAHPGDILILTKPLGTGIIVAAKRIGEAKEELYQEAVATMKMLNKTAAQIMQEFDIKTATDITGFGLLGHALKIALASNVNITMYSKKIPVIEGVYDLVEAGCVSCVMRRNLEFVTPNTEFCDSLDNNFKMIMLDAITSGGILMSVPASKADKILDKLQSAGMVQAAVIGNITNNEKKLIIN